MILKCKKEPVAVGDVAPEFELISQTGEAVALSGFRGKNVVLYFYPKDNTRGCIVESTSFRDAYPEFQNHEAVLLGVSSDTAQSHLNFARQYGLPFKLLSDPKGSVRKRYGVQNTLGVIPGRVTFVIDKAGVVRHVFSSQFNPKSHVKQSLAALAKL